MEFKLLSNQTPFLKIASKSVPLEDTPTIIFAPNGAGKTTLFKNLIVNHSDLVIPYIYDEGINPTYKAIEGKRAKIVINPAYGDYEAVHQKCQDLFGKLSFKAQIKAVFGSPTNTKQSHPAIAACSKNKTEATIQSISRLSDEQRTKLKPLLASEDDIKKALQNYQAIKELGEDEKRADAWLATHLDIVAAISYVHLDEHREEIENDGCPFCGGRGKSGNPFLDLKETAANLAAKEMLVFRDYDFLRGVYDAREAIDLIDSVREGLSSLSDDQAVSLCFTLGRSDKEIEIQKNIDELRKAQAEEQKFLAVRNAKYDLMVEASEYIKQAFSESYPGAKLEFDNEQKTLSIVMPRGPNSYSEGEKHDIYRTIINLSVIGSTKDIVLIDDPLTEFDAANEYKAVFSFVRMVHDVHKNPIIFTCNATLINLATKYDARTFKLLYMDSRKTQDGIEVCLRHLELSRKPETGFPYLTLKNLIKDEPQMSPAEKIVKVVIKRAILAENNGDLGEKDKLAKQEASKILHYDSSFSSSVFGLANDELVSYVEGFVPPKLDAPFVKAAQEKIALLAAMRVYLEKHLFEYDAARGAKGYQPCLPNKKTLFEKIDAVDGCKDYPIKDLYTRWNRKSLVEMKALLNDADHPFGLVHPLHFALSLGWDTLLWELNLLKSFF